MKCWLLFGVLKDKQINCDTDAWDDGMDLGWDGMDDHGMDGMGSFCSEATTLKKEELHHDELDNSISK
jgi:hypothetical protein